MIEYERRTISSVVSPKGDPIFSERATTISICDEAAGEYIEISQAGRDGLGKILIDLEEWEPIRNAVSYMIKQCSEQA